MKKLFVFGFALLFAGCGGGKGSKMKFSENEVLGKFPSVYMTLDEEDDRLEEEVRIKTASSNNADKNIKIFEEAIARKEANLKFAHETAAAELEKIRGREVPFRVIHEDPWFEVVSATIEDAYIPSGAMTINVKVEAKQDIQRSTSKRLYYLVMGKDNLCLFKSTLNPFVQNQITSTNDRTRVGSGELCYREGSWLMLYCGSYDFTDFVEIYFVNKEFYDSLR